MFNTISIPSLLCEQNDELLGLQYSHHPVHCLANHRQLRFSQDFDASRLTALFLGLFNNAV
jgi:hypothetical protein